MLLYLVVLLLSRALISGPAAVARSATRLVRVARRRRASPPQGLRRAYKMRYMREYMTKLKKDTRKAKNVNKRLIIVLLIAYAELA